MGTWCTEGVKRTMREHRREEAEIQRKRCAAREREYEEKCKVDGICPRCKQAKKGE